MDHTRSDAVSLLWNAPPSNTITIEYWFRISDEFNAESTVINYSIFDGDAGASIPDAFNMHHRQDRSFVFFQTATQASCTAADCMGVGRDGWEHWAVTWDGISGSVSYYRNGNQVYSENLASANPIWGMNNTQLQTGGCFMVGQDADRLCGDFDEFQALDGLIDELRIWNIVRTPQEIIDNYDKAIDPSTSGLNLYWNFDDFGNAVVSDLTGNGNNANLGSLPSLENRMTYSSASRINLSLKPTTPAYVTSGVPSALGGKLVTSFQPGNALEISLTARGGNPAEALQTYITRLPQFGSLTLMNGTAVNLGDEVIDIANLQSKRLVYTYSGVEKFDSFEYTTVDTSNMNASATVELHAFEGLGTAPDDSLVMEEDGFLTIVLGKLDFRENLLGVEITALPTKGKLYQLAFNGDIKSYNTLLLDTNNLTEIATPFTSVNNTRGVLIYKPDTDQYNSTGFDSFQYRLTNPGDTPSSIGEISITVTPLNDAPEPQALDVDLNAVDDDYVTFTLQSSDVDQVFFAENPIYRIVDFPRIGVLHQVNQNGSVGDRITFENAAEITMWAVGVMNASSQFSRCDRCFNFTACLENPCDETAWHATQLIGPNDVPSYGDIQQSWATTGPDTVGEFVELEYEIPVFVNAIEIYESFHPGAVSSIQVASTYDGINTNWKTIWGAETFSSQPEQLRRFQPPVCPSSELVKYLRLELASEEVASYNEIDAVRLFGAQNPSRGSVSDVTGHVIYKLDKGIHSVDEGLFDFFTYTVSDCLDESTTPARVEIRYDNPTIKSGNYFYNASAILRRGVRVPISLELQRVIDIARDEHRLSSTPSIVLMDVVGSGSYDIEYPNGTALSIGNVLPTEDLVVHLEKDSSVDLEFWITIEPVVFRVFHSLEVQEDDELSDAARITFYAFAAAGVIFTIVLICLTLYWYNTPQLKTASVVFLLVILIGVFVFYCSMALVSSTNAVACSIKIWALALAFTATYGTLFVRTYRIWRIFSNKKVKPVIMPDIRLIMYICALLLVDIVILTVMQIVDAPEIQTETKDFKLTKKCKISLVWYLLLIIYKGLMLLFGIAMSISVRNVSSAYNESRYIGFSIYNLALTSVLFIPLIFFLTVSLTVAEFFLFAYLWISTTVTVSMIFIPKIISVIKGETLVRTSQYNMKFVGKSSTPRATSGSSYDDVQMLKAKITKLEHHIANLQKQEGPGNASVLESASYTTEKSSVIDEDQTDGLVDNEVADNAVVISESSASEDEYSTDA